MRTLFTFVLAVCLLAPAAFADQWSVPHYSDAEFVEIAELQTGTIGLDDSFTSGVWDVDEIAWGQLQWRDTEFGTSYAPLSPWSGLGLVNYVPDTHQHYGKFALLRARIETYNVDSLTKIYMNNRTFGTGELIGVWDRSWSSDTQYRYTPIYDGWKGIQLRNGHLVMTNSTIYTGDVSRSGTTAGWDDEGNWYEGGFIYELNDSALHLLSSGSGNEFIRETDVSGAYIFRGESTFEVYAPYAESYGLQEDPFPGFEEGGYGQVRVYRRDGQSMLFEIDGSSVAIDTGTINLAGRANVTGIFRFITDEGGNSTWNVHSADGVLGGAATQLDFQLGAAPDPGQIFVLFNLTDEAASYQDYGYGVRLYDMDWDTLEEGDYIGLEYDGTTYDYYITYQYGDGGNNVALVPEPATVALLTLGGLFAIRRRRNA